MSCRQEQRPAQYGGSALPRTSSALHSRGVDALYILGALEEMNSLKINYRCTTDLALGVLVPSWQPQILNYYSNSNAPRLLDVATPEVCADIDKQLRKTVDLLSQAWRAFEGECTKAQVRPKDHKSAFVTLLKPMLFPLTLKES